MLQLLATSASGIESLVRRELADLGYEARVVSPGRIQFEAEADAICRTNLWLRTADRVLVLVARFSAPDFDALFETTKSLPWEQWIEADGSFPVDARSRKSQLTSVPALQRTVKRAIVDRLRAAHGVEELPESGPLYRIEVALLDDEATLTIDTTGPGLQKRGYRSHSDRATLRETLAATLVQLSFWNPERPLIDPFCGTGTIPIEAALQGRNIAPGLLRAFAAEQWPQLDATLWSTARESARAARRPALPVRVVGNDISEHAVRLARQHAETAGVAEDVHFQQLDFRDLSSSREYGCIVTNPPYDPRQADQAAAVELHRMIPVVLRRLSTWSHFVLTALPNFEALINKQADRRRKLYDGSVECTYYQYHGPRPEGGRDGPQSAGEPPTDSEADGTDTEVAETEMGGKETGGKETGETGQKPPGRRTTTATREATGSAPTVPASEDADSTRLPQARHPDTARATPTESAETRHVAADRKKTPRPASAPVFGGIGPKAREQAELFRARLRKRARHFRRWPTRQDIHCFRLYERDIPEIPLIVDRYEDHLHLVEYERPHDRDLAEHADWLELMRTTAAEALEVERSKVHLKHKLGQSGKTQYERTADQRYEIAVREGGLRFWVNLSDYVDTGLFLDHRITRSMVRDVVKDRRVLNLFAYTGAFSVYAADGGAASVTTVDWSATYVQWAQRNFELNEFRGPQFQFVQQDVRQFVEGMSAETRFDVVVVDPPTFSNSKRTDEDWEVQRDHARLLTRLLQHLAPGGRIYFSTNFRRFKLHEDEIPAETIHEISRQTVPEDFRNRRIHRCWILEK